MVTINFKNIEALKAYLRADDYDQSPLKVTFDEVPSVGELNEFAAILQEERFPCLVVAAADRQMDFNNLFLSNQRYQLQQRLKQAGHLKNDVTLELLSDKKNNFEEVSRAKVNLGRGLHAESGGLQFQKQQQVQQQRQQQVQQQQAMQTMLDKRQQQLAARNANSVPAFVPNELSEDDLKKLIHRKNIVSELYKPENFLLKVWDDLVGEHASEVAGQFPKRVISFLTPDAMKKVLENVEHFRYGLVMDNLPDGFYLQEWKDKIILGYDERSISHKKNPMQALKINLEKPKQEDIAGDVRQFSANLSEDKQKQFKVSYEMLFTGSKPLAEKQTAFIDLLLIANDQLQASHIIELLKSLNLYGDEHAIAGLSKVYLAGGAEVVLLLLNKWAALQRTNQFDDFKSVFLRGKSDYSEFVTPEAMTDLDIIKNFDVSERIWWKALTIQHRQSTATADLRELCAAFVFSIAEIKRMTEGQPLPLKHPFGETDGFNMKVALNRLLIILGRAIDKEEQVRLLEGLDLSSEGAIVAAMHDDYKLTSAEMNLSFENRSVRLLNDSDPVIRLVIKRDDFMVGDGRQHRKEEIGVRKSELNHLDSKIKKLNLWKRQKWGGRRIQAFSSVKIEALIEKIKNELPDLFSKIDKDDGNVIVQSDGATVEITRNWERRIGYVEYQDYDVSAELIVFKGSTRIYALPFTKLDLEQGLETQMNEIETKNIVSPKIVNDIRNWIQKDKIGEMIINLSYSIYGFDGFQLKVEYAGSKKNDDIELDNAKDKFQSQYHLPGDDHPFVKQIAATASYGTNLKYFFRYIGQQPWTLPFEFYRSVARKMARDFRQDIATDVDQAKINRLNARKKFIEYIERNIGEFFRLILDKRDSLFNPNYSRKHVTLSRTGYLIYQSIIKSGAGKYFLKNATPKAHLEYDGKLKNRLSSEKIMLIESMINTLNRMRKLSIRAFVSDRILDSLDSDTKNAIFEIFASKSESERDEFIAALNKAEAYAYDKYKSKPDKNGVSIIRDDEYGDAQYFLESFVRIFTLINKLTNELNHELNDLAAHDEMRNLLLHLVAQTTTTKRQLLAGEDSAAIDNVISSIDRVLQRADDKKEAERHLAAVLRACQRGVALLPEDIKPSIGDIQHLFHMLLEKNRSFSIDDLNYMLNRVESYGEVIYDMLAVRESRCYGNGSHLERFDSSGLVVFGFVQMMDKASGITLERKVQLLYMLTRVSDPKSVTAEVLPLLANELDALPPVIAGIFIKLMRKIQLDKSSSLPSMDALLAAIKDAKQFKELTATTEEEMTEFLQNRWPDTFLTKKRPASNILMDIVGTMRSQIDDLKVNDMIKSIPSAMTGLVGDQIDTFRALDAELRKSTVNLNDLMQRLTDFEASIAKLLSGMKGIMIRGMYDKAVGEDGSPAMKKYMETGKFAVLLEEPLKENLANVINGMTAQLQVKDDFLDQYLVNFVGAIDVTKDIGKILEAYSYKANAVKDFTGVLTDVYNRSAKDFKKVYELLKNHKDNLTLKMHQALMDSCLSDENIFVSEKMEIVYKILSEPGKKYENKNIQYALVELKKFMPYASMLSADTFKFIMEKSFKHHAEKGTAFPANPLIELLKSGGEREKTLVQHILNLISKSDEIVESEMIKAITLTSKILRTTPAASQLVQILAEIRQDGSLDSWTHFANDLEVLDSNQHHADKMASVIKIMRGVLSDSAEFDVAALLRQLLSADSNSLTQIASLYQFKPYPAHDKIPDIMQCVKDGTLAAWVQKFDLDPFAVRDNDKVTAEQYSTSQLDRAVTGIRFMPDNDFLPDHEQARLIKQCTYITAVGNGVGISYKNAQALPLTKWTRADLRSYADNLIQQIRENKLAEAELEKIRLTLLAVLREAYFRNTGKVPNSTQMVAAIMSINHPGHILLQLNTGEGKSILSSLLVTMEWVKGAAVNFCTSTSDLANRDEEGAALFCDFLGIEHKLITNDSAPNTYAKSGINYSTMAETSLYRASAKLFGEKIKVKGAPATTLYIDESDAATLDSYSTAFNLAIASDENPYAWIYPLINTFVDKPEYLNLDSEKGPVWDVKQDLHHLKDYLREEVRDPEKKKQLAALNDAQFKKWLSSATIAKQHREGSEFVISRETRKVKGVEVTVDLAVPLDKSVPQVGSTRDNGVQQFLHARLQKEKTNANPGKVYFFPIDSESFKSATETARNYIQRHTRKNGRLIGVSATLGSIVELAEQESKYQVQAFTIPPHLASKMEIKDAKFVREKERNSEVVEQLKSFRVKKNKKLSIEPQLIFTRDINDAHLLFAHLDDKDVKKSFKIDGLIINIITGEETANERKAKWDAAGKPNTITVTTPISTRGVDIPHDANIRLCDTPTRVERYRYLEQQKGRAGRYGKGGVYAPLFALSDSDIARYGIDLTKGSAKTREKNLKRIFDLMDEDAAIERHYTEEMDAVQNIALDLYNKWNKLILRVNHQNPDIAFALGAAREALINDMSTAWVKMLEESDPDKLYANIYVRRNAQGEFETKELDQALVKFEEMVIARWQRELAVMKGKYLANVDVESQHPDALTYKRYDAMDIQEAIAIRQAKCVEEKADLPSIPARSQAKDVLLHAATDISAAYADYAPGLAPAEKNKYAKAALHNQVMHFGNWLPKVVKAADMKRSDKKQLNSKLKELMAVAMQDPASTDSITFFDKAFAWINSYYTACANPAQRYQTQPFVREMIHLADKMQYKSLALVTVKQHYVDNAYGEIKQQLEHALAWRKNGAWYHKIERKVAKAAADEILKAVSADPSAVGDEELKNLYKVLLKQKMQLENKFTIGFLHQNIKTTIRNGLASLDYLLEMRGGSNDLKQQAKAEVSLEEKAPIKSLPKNASKIKETQLRALADELNIPCESIKLSRKHQGFRENYLLVVKMTSKEHADKWQELGLKEKTPGVYCKTFANWSAVRAFEQQMLASREDKLDANDKKLG